MAMELGETTDPKELIPGNPGSVRPTYMAMRRYGDALHQAGSGLSRIDTADGWTGPAGDAFRAKFEGQPGKWLEAGATHNRRQFPIAMHLFEATGQYPPRWYVATWMAGHLVQDGRANLATELLTEAFPDWIPYAAWDLLPTEIWLQPYLRPAVTTHLRETILSSVDISRVPGVTP